MYILCIPNPILGLPFSFGAGSWAAFKMSNGEKRRSEGSAEGAGGSNEGSVSAGAQEAVGRQPALKLASFFKTIIHDSDSFGYTCSERMQ